jgi:hypothetical protein
MAFQKEEKDQLVVQLVQELSHTPYACSSLTQLSGGTANFLFRGILAHPLPDGTQTVVVKHSKEFVAANRNFSLEVSRCVRIFFPLSFVIRERKLNIYIYVNI